MGDATSGNDVIGPDGGCDAGAFATDPNNCGACNHSCLGGGCEAGMCQPIVLATGQFSVYTLAVDSKNVYWATALTVGNVQKCAIGGCGGIPTTLSAGENSAQGPVVDSKSVYW
jgi:hypothetical protein